MINKIKELVEELTPVCDNYVKYQMPLRADVYKHLPAIQEFTECVFRMITDAEVQQDMMEILNDMLSALEQEDEVLLYDALRYGLMEYMKVIIEISEEE